MPASGAAQQPYEGGVYDYLATGLSFKPVCLRSPPLRPHVNRRLHGGGLMQVYELAQHRKSNGAKMAAAVMQMPLALGADCACFRT